MAISIPLCLAFALAVSPRLASGPTSVDARDPERNFEALWNSLDGVYAQFGNKQADWDALYDVYRPQVTSETTDDELFDLLIAMMAHLNDSHLNLQSETRSANAGLIDRPSRRDFSLDLVESEYLHEGVVKREEGGLTAGWVSDGIGYLHIASYNRDMDAAIAAMDEVMAEFVDAEAMIVDVRDNQGGLGNLANRLADRFADRKRHFMTSKVRYGAGHEDFVPDLYHHVQPRGPHPFTEPVVLLTNRSSASAAERFTLALSVLPHVTHVGDYTSGAFSSQMPDWLPNGWTVLISYKVSLDHLGFCWDGIGIIPDLRITNADSDIKAGEDRVLDFAIRLLEEADLALQNEESSLVNVRTCLVEEFSEHVEERGLDAALVELDRARAQLDETFFLSPEQCIRLAQRYRSQEKTRETIAILNVCKEEFPKMATTYGMLAQIYLREGQQEQARAILEQADLIHPYWPGERLQISSLRQQLGLDAGDS